MKTLLLLLVTTCLFAQKEGYIALMSGLDVRNATVGSAPTQNKPELDIIAKFIMVGKDIEVNVLYERFEAISFAKYGFGVGYHFPLYSKYGKTVFIPSIEPCLIDRWGEEWQVSSSHLSIGANASLRWFFTDHLGAELLFNALPRTDLKARYGGDLTVVTSGYACLIYKI